MRLRIPRTDDFREVDFWREAVSRGSGGGSGTCIYIDVTKAKTPVLPSNSAATNTANMKTLLQNVEAGATLYFPEGTYKFAKDGTNNWAILISKAVSLVGASYTKTKLVATGTDYHLIDIRLQDLSTDTVSITNVCLEAETLVPYSATFHNYFAGLHLRRTRFCRFSYIIIRKFGYGVYLDNGASEDVNTSNRFSWIITLECRVGIRFRNNYSHQGDNFISDCIFIGDFAEASQESNYNAGIHIEGTYVGDIWIYDSVIIRVRTGIYIRYTGGFSSGFPTNYAHNVNIINSWVEIHHTHGYYIENMMFVRLTHCGSYGRGHSFLGTSVQAVTITQCLFYLVSSGTACVELTGSTTVPSYGCIISNCLMVGGNTFRGLLLRGLRSSTITGNFIDRCSDGVFLTLSGSIGCDRNVLSSNSITRCSTGVNIGSGSNRTTVMANVFDATIPISDSGTSSIIQGNQT